MDIDNLIVAKRQEVLDIGIEAIVYALFNIDCLQDMAIESEGNHDDQPILNTWGFMASQGILWFLQEVMREVPDIKLQLLANGTNLSRDEEQNEAAYQLFNPIIQALIAGRVVAKMNPAATGFDQHAGQVIWSGSSEPEFIEYIKVAAVDHAHTSWLKHLTSQFREIAEWVTEVDEDLKKKYDIALEELMTALELLEYWMYNPEEKAKTSPDIPMYRLDAKHFEKPLKEKFGENSAHAIISALTWNKITELSKHPLISDGKESYIFFSQYCKYLPSLTQSWLYPYFYHGHNTIAGIAGNFRGGIFEQYLKNQIETTVGCSCVRMNKILTHGNCPSLSKFELPHAEIDHAVNLGKIGLLIDAKGGMIELPKDLDKIRWHAITPNDVYNRFEENKENSSKWDKVVEAVREETSILEEMELIKCEKIIPMIVHSKVQPIMLEKYRKVHRCPNYETETHSLQSLILRVEEILGK